MADASATRARRRDHRERVRSSVRRATLELVADAPFKDLTVDEITRAAGLSRSAFYLYFRDKQDLLMAATEEVVDALLREADRWWHGEGDPETRVRAALRGVAAVYERHANLVRVATEVSSYDEEVRTLWRGLVGRFIAATAEHLRGEQAEGRVTADLDPQSAAESLVWMVERCCYIYLATGERSPEELVDALTRMWIAALYRPAGSAVDGASPGAPGRRAGAPPVASP